MYSQLALFHCACAFTFISDSEEEIDCGEEVEELESMCVTDCNLRTPGLDGDNETGICWGN